MPLVTLKNLTVGHGHRAVLENVDLELEAGAFAGLLGANGSGKSTLLKTIAGILPAQRGEVQVHRPDGGRPVLGYVPQRESLDPLFLFTAHEVALLGACARVGPGRFHPAAEKTRALECLERTGAADLARRLFSELSGGQKQRVLIARALMTAPDLLLLDEPTTGLDPAATASILDLLESLHTAGQLTILMVNHDLQAVRRHVREVFWIHRGRILHGTPDTLLSRERLDELLDLELP